MKRLLVCFAMGMLLVSYIGCSGGTTEAQPDQIPGINEENVPPVGE